MLNIMQVKMFNSLTLNIKQEFINIRNTEHKKFQGSLFLTIERLLNRR